MHREVFVNIDDQEYRFDLAERQPMPNEMARKWLDDQFVAMECEPLRASGKLLLADKVLVVARAAGKDRIGDAFWGGLFAAAAAAALGKPVVRVDVNTMSVSY